MLKKVRFRTLGCYPLTGAIESEADTLTAIIQEMLLAHDVGAAGPPDRPRPVGVDGEEEAGGVLLMAHISDLIATDIDAYLHAARAQEPAALHHLRQRRRRQEHADRPPAVRLEDDLRGPAGGARSATRRRSAPQGGELDFALLVDGLAAEREQGITIDVAYRFFSTDKRKFIVADTPGHEQYTRNMVTGASTADLAVILIDARKGVLTQTRRHSYLVSTARHPQGRAGDQQDGPGRLRRGDLPPDRRRLPRSSARRSASRTSSPSRCPACAATTSPRPARTRPGTTGPTLMDYLETVEIEEPRAAPAVAPAGAVGQPAQPRLPRLCRHARQRHRRQGERVRVLPSGRESTRHAHRHHGRRPRPSGRRPVGHADARRRDRHQPRRRASRAPTTCRASRTSSSASWCGCRTSRCCPAGPTG